MRLTEWSWVVLVVFFIMQGVVATYLIRSILRLRASQHRIANYLQLIGGQLEKRGLVSLANEQSPTGKASLGDSGG